MKIRSKEELQDYINCGNFFKYLFFWGHANKGDQINKTCFSQWYDSPFFDDGVEFITAEHYMMAEKAKLFNDMNIYKKVLNADNPGKAKALGREINGFDEVKWNKNRFDIVVNANLLKFNQNPDLGNFLINTGNRVLVEASPVDRI